MTGARAETSWRHAFLGSFAASGLVTAIGLVTSVVTARVLGPEGRGVLAVVVTWTAFAIALSQFPISHALVLVRKEEGTVRGEVNRAALALARRVVALVLPPALIVLAAVYARYDGVPLLFALVYPAIALPANIQWNTYRGILQADHRFGVIQSFVVAQPLFYCVLVVFAGLSGAEVEVFILAHALAIVMVFAARYWIVDPGEGSPAGSQGQLGRRLAGHARSIYGHNVARILSNHIVRLIVVAVATLAETGQFVVAFVIASLVPKILGDAIRMMGLPALRHFEGAGRISAARRLLSMSWLTALIGAAATAAIGPVLLPLLYGESFAPAASLVPLLAVAMMPMAVSDSFIEILKSCGANRALAYAGIGYVAGYSALALGLYTAGLGLFGIALALAAANLLYLAALAAVAGREMPQIGGRDWLLPTPARIGELVTLAMSLTRRRREER